MANKFRKYGLRTFRQIEKDEDFLPGKKYMITKKSFSAFENDYDENKGWIKDISCIEFQVTSKKHLAEVCNNNMLDGYSVYPYWCYEIIENGGKK